MDTSDYSNECCGVRLLRLIDTQSPDIAGRETGNSGRMRLYCTGEYWHGFENSAYLLESIFPEADSFIVSHPDFPFKIVAASVPERDFRKFRRTHEAVCRKEDYAEYDVTPPVPSEYGEWHRKKVKHTCQRLNFPKTR